uniref:NADH-ubiquinone oxidoreductase chain 2 n=1 Tax=Cercodemas anceps TaxID=2785214 RepID=A0A7S8FIT0_9ECHN|nr:NADH dehydrogenase subunit 2 [Cercodemas anceps]QPD06749.1 NADH dehydrogenase subunit 2 [Cercodemas anceps]
MNNTIIIFLSTTLISGTTLVILSNHWFSIWIGLEISTLSLIPLININNSPRSNEATIKYFLVQAISAAILLNGATLNLWITNSWEINETYNSNISNSIIIIAILIKLGIAPCHFWLPDVLSGLPFFNAIIIACWQKIAPFFILTSMTNNIPNEIILLSSCLSVLIGGWGGLNQTSIRKILAFSSISHMGWITATSFFSPNISLALFTFYILNNTSIFLICHNSNLYNLANLNKTNIIPFSSTLFSLSILSLGGLPPLGGFINKLIPLNLFIINNNLIIIPIFILGSLVNLFFYLRIVFNTSLIIFPKSSINFILINTETSKNINVLISTIAPLIFLGIFLIPIIDLIN